MLEKTPEQMTKAEQVERIMELLEKLGVIPPPMLPNNREGECASRQANYL